MHLVHCGYYEPCEQCHSVECCYYKGQGSRDIFLNVIDEGNFFVNMSSFTTLNATGIINRVTNKLLSQSLKPCSMSLYIKLFHMYLRYTSLIARNLLYHGV